MNTSPDRETVVAVVVLDDRRLIREGIESVLAVRPGIRVIPPDEAERGYVSVVGQVAAPVVPASRHIVRLVDARDIDDLVTRIRQAAGGHAAATHDRVRSLPDAAAPLTPRERAVLRAVSGGASAADIADELGISTRTVERHKQAVMAKLGVRSQARAVAVSLARGLLHDAG